jgi:DNA-binding protein HU-beta
MKKTEVVSKVAEKTGLKKIEAEKAVDALLATIEEGFKAGEKVAFVGFEPFEVTQRSAKKGRNPQIVKR